MLVSLQLKESYAIRNMISCTSVWQNITLLALALKCVISMGRLIAKRYHVLLQLGKQFA